MYSNMCKLNLESVYYDMRYFTSPPSKKGNAKLFNNIVKTIKNCIKKDFSSKGKPTPKDGLVSKGKPTPKDIFFNSSEVRSPVENSWVLPLTFRVFCFRLRMHRFYLMH